MISNFYWLTIYITTLPNSLETKTPSSFNYYRVAYKIFLLIDPRRLSYIFNKLYGLFCFYIYYLTTSLTFSFLLDYIFLSTYFLFLGSFLLSFLPPFFPLPFSFPCSYFFYLDFVFHVDLDDRLNYCSSY